MARKMTISMDEELYHGLLAVVGRRKISSFISDLVRPHVLEGDLEGRKTSGNVMEALDASMAQYDALYRELAK